MEVWGLSGEAAQAAQLEARAREERFVEQVGTRIRAWGETPPVPGRVATGIAYSLPPQTLRSYAPPDSLIVPLRSQTYALYCLQQRVIADHPPTPPLSFLAPLGRSAQRKHVDRAAFAEDWENSPDRAILGFAAGGVTGRETARFSKAEEAMLDRHRAKR